MIQKELYIIRHGETDHNAKGIIQGKGVDLSLNETGRKQAEAFYNAYKRIPFEVIYTSSLRRAQESIELFKQHNIPHFAHSELDEISWGDLEGKITTHETDASFREVIAKWQAGEIHVKPSATGESPYDLQQRQSRFVSKLIETPHSRILIATHGRFIRAFMCTLTGLPLSKMEEFNHVNLCLYKVVMHENGKFEIVLNCDRAHLDAL